MTVHELGLRTNRWGDLEYLVDGREVSAARFAEAARESGVVVVQRLADIQRQVEPQRDAVWSVKPSTQRGVWWLLHRGREAGSLQLVEQLTTPALTLQRVCEALNRDGEP